MAYIDFQPKDQFSATPYSGNSSTNAVTLQTGFSPSYTWLKKGSGTSEMYVFDKVNGAQYYLSLFETIALTNNAASLVSFDDNGFTLGSGDWNATGSTYISYSWKDGSTSVPSGGSITPSAANVNTTNGIGIYKYTGNATSGATIAHGLGVAPRFLIAKKLSPAGGSWAANSSFSFGSTIFRNSYAAQVGDNCWNSTAPTSTLITLGNDGSSNNSGSEFIMYAYAPIKGFSAYGSFEGNGSTNGEFIYTGFRPKWVRVKKTNTGSCNWIVWDTDKNTDNLSDWYLYTDDGGGDAGYAQDSTNYAIDILSNGFN